MKALRTVTNTEIHLDALRGAAALVVVLGHARGLFFPSLSGGGGSPLAEQGSTLASTALGEQISIGHQAVMVFFVLSGYLVGGSVINSLRKGNWDWSQYLVRRLVRLWIVLGPAIFVGAILDTIGFGLLSQPGSLYTAPAGQPYVTTDMAFQVRDVTTIVGNLLFLQSIFVSTLGTNIPLWSLSYEFWYYIAFPMLMLVFWRRVPLATRMACAACVIAILAIMGPHASFLFMIWCLGALISALPRLIPERHSRPALVLCFGLFAIAFLSTKRLAPNIYAAELIIAIFAAVLIYAIVNRSGTPTCRSYRLLSRFFSNISYTLYLTHLPFLVFVCALINNPWALSGFSVEKLIQFGFVSALSVLWAYAMYLAFESRTDVFRAAVFNVIGKRAATQGNLS